MSRGRPDWHQIVTMEGWDGTDLVTIKVDDLGQLYAIMRGDYLGAPKTVALDTDGFLYAILKGEFAGALKTVALDTNGVMKANLVAQDVAKLYAYVTSGKSETLSYSGTTNNMLTSDGVMITEHGTVQGGYIAFKIQGPNCAYNIEVKVDGLSHGKHTVQEWYEWGFVQGRGFPFSIGSYPCEASEYTVFHLAYDIAFDTSFQFLIWNMFDAIDYHCDIHYSTTPTP